MTGERGFDFSPSHLLVKDLEQKTKNLEQTFGTKNWF